MMMKKKSEYTPSIDMAEVIVISCKRQDVIDDAFFDGQGVPADPVVRDTLLTRITVMFRLMSTVIRTTSMTGRVVVGGRTYSVRVS
jgi:hypothetical protein